MSNQQAPMYLVVDVEATCWKSRHQHQGENEIIEIGAVLANSAGQVIGEYGNFIRPVRNPILSDFCKSLTSIQQSDVDTARVFPEALVEFQQQMEQLAERAFADLLFCSWGDYDRKQFAKDCGHHRLAYPFGTHWNVKRAFARRRHIKPMGVGRALRFLGMQFEGTHHRGIDDARNIAQVFCHELADGVIPEPLDA